MTRMIIDIKDQKDIRILSELVDRLKLHYSIEVLPSTSMKEIDWDSINRGIDISKFGNPVDWQKEQRKERSIYPAMK